MTDKQIHYSTHAANQRDERGITRGDVRWLLKRGIRRKAPTYAGDQRWEAVGYIGHREASVIFIEDASRYLIVTVQWIEKPKEDR